MLVYLSVGLMGLGLTIMVRRYDRYQRESWGYLLLAILLGALSAFMVGPIEDHLIFRLGEFGYSLTGMAAIAAICEELIKCGSATVLVCCIRRTVKDPFHGILYGALVGLGFALEESRFYLSLSTNPVIPQIGQEAVRLVLHLVLSGVGAMALGYWRLRGRGLGILLATLTLSIGLHFLWDLLCGLPATTVGVSISHRVFAIALMLSAMFSFGMAVKLGWYWSKHHAQELRAQSQAVRNRVRHMSDSLSGIFTLQALDESRMKLQHEG